MTQAVSIIIVNWNVREMLRECLSTLLASAGLSPAEMQVIVVDNGSKDGSADMVVSSFPGVTLIANKDNPGFGRANNQALPLCTAPYVLLLNPDTVVMSGAIATMIAKMEKRPDVAALGCRLLNADGSLQRWTGGAFPRIWNVVNHYLFLDLLLPRTLRPASLYLDHDSGVDIDVDWLSGACLMLRQNMLNDRLFDPTFFMYGEDMELCHRLKTAGHRIVYSPAACIVHYQGASMKQQQGEVLLASLKGPRQFYSKVRGGKGLKLFDSVTLAGFALRWLLYSVAALIRPHSNFAARAASSRDLMNRARRIQKG